MSDSTKRRRTIVLSDVHLSQAHPDDPNDRAWMRYRRSEHHPDEELSSLIDRVLADFAGDEIDLVYNGDVLDFDAPWVKDGTSSFDEYPMDEAGCAEQCRRILDDHPIWFEATARVLAAGHRVMFLSGNHDIELCWPAVRAVVRDDLLARVERIAGAEARASAEARLRFRTWFHVTEDRIYLEHGSQYDIYNGVPWPMLPVTRKRDRIHPVLGKQAFKRTGSRMGYFNPYYEETFYLGLVGYARHFAEHYAGSDRDIVRTWLMGALRTAREIWDDRHLEDWAPENARLAQEETGAPIDSIHKTQALRAHMAEIDFIPVLRELWLDRLGFVAALAVPGAIGALFGWKAGVAALGVLGAGFAAYEFMTPKPDIRTYDSAPPTVRQLWDIHGVRAICMGHTHRPFSIWEDGRFYGNSGSWCPAFEDQDCTKPVLERRPLLILTSEAEELRGGLHWWKHGKLEADSAG